MWAPAIQLHYDSLRSPLFQMLEMNEQKLSRSIGSLDVVDFLPSIVLLLPAACVREQLMGINCSFIDEILGLGTRQLDETVFLGSFLEYTDESSLHEFAQLVQSGQRNAMHFFDFREPQKNALAYGSLSQPKYKINKVTLDNMIIWQGNSDRLVNQFDTLILRKQLRSK